MPTITKDFEEIYLKPTPNGWEFTEQESYSPYHLRVEIEGTDREDWNVTKISLVDTYKIIGENRWGEVETPLEGKLFSDAMHFLTYSEKLMDDLQDKVNQEIVPNVSGPWPYETFVGGV